MVRRIKTTTVRDDPSPTIISKVGKRCPRDQEELVIDWNTGIFTCPYCKRQFNDNLSELPKV